MLLPLFNAIIHHFQRPRNYRGVFTALTLGPHLVYHPRELETAMVAVVKFKEEKRRAQFVETMRAELELEL